MSGRANLVMDVYINRFWEFLDNPPRWYRRASYPAIFAVVFPLTVTVIVLAYPVLAIHTLWKFSRIYAEEMTGFVKGTFFPTTNAKE